MTTEEVNEQPSHSGYVMPSYIKYSVHNNDVNTVQQFEPACSDVDDRVADSSDEANSDEEDQGEGDLGGCPSPKRQALESNGSNDIQAMLDNPSVPLSNTTCSRITLHLQPTIAFLKLQVVVHSASQRMVVSASHVYCLQTLAIGGHFQEY